MKKVELTKEESEAYTLVVASGNMDDIFDLGYIIGRERAVKEVVEDFKSVHSKNL